MSDRDDQNRLLIATFIVATTFTVMATHVPIPKLFFIPAGAFLIGLIITAVLAFVFILAKGYELRYGSKNKNLVDRYNYLLYNLAVTAYVIVAGVLLFLYIFSILNNASEAGNVLATIGIVILFISIVFVISRKDIKLLADEIVKRIRDKKLKTNSEKTKP